MVNVSDFLVFGCFFFSNMRLNGYMQGLVNLKAPFVDYIR